ncbi:MAG: serine/threonine-protein phosphatase [Rhodocyclaceae bacterium]|jgi:serine/threonine protein phosphatase PrpC|nr:serine/threonine-protein phosphatase [Rhodocyclaceae bacterium]MBK9309738.1 serine/threonine-protein phosphatase [Rhodocyclaceae bacterium]
MKFTIYQESRIGRRRNNQDRIAHCYSRDALLMVLADGMGGHLHGEVAAQIAVQYLTEAFQREARPRLEDPFRFLANGLENAHRAIVDYTDERDLPDAPRTTCVVCVVQDNIAYWAHAGDSRLYLLRGGRVVTRTRDHSRVQMMVDEGVITEHEALRHPARNRVFSCLGGDVAPQIDFSRRTPLKAGDVILLCTDGFWAPLGNEELARGYTNGDVMAATPAMMDRAEALAGESGDNLSVVTVHWHEGYDEDTTSGVATETMSLDAHTTQMQGFDKGRAAEPDLTEDDIERAIAEIQNAINKYSK